MADDKVDEFLALFDVAAVNRRVLVQAAESRFADYEDSVLHNAAQTAGADGLVTRNADDFAAATLSVYTPTELVTIIKV